MQRVYLLLASTSNHLYVYANHKLTRAGNYTRLIRVAKNLSSANPVLSHHRIYVTIYSTFEMSITKYSYYVIITVQATEILKTEADGKTDSFYGVAILFCCQI